MQTIPRTDTVVTGFIQTPLLTEDQIEPGMFIAGTTMQNIWRIDAHDPITGMLSLMKQPAVPIDPGHVHAFILHGNTTCACGHRRQSIRGEATGLLPLRPNTPRVYLIKPRESLIMPDKFTIYLDSRGRTITLDSQIDATWSELVPIIPALAPVWTLPESLRGLL